MSIKSWVKDRQHAMGVRQALDLAQSAYGVVRRIVADDTPASAGGWPLRVVPMPSPRPITRFERHALQRAGRSQSASFFDGHAVKRFGGMLVERWRCGHALAVSSGTAALHTALMAAGIGPGDEVVVPVMTYVATALAVLQAGAVPRFVDADPETWNIDPSRIEEVVNERTKAIIPVHIGGVPCDMEAIRRIADRHGLLVIEDAAHAHGSTLNDRWLGTLGDMGCFSFGSPKTITTGEGGALLTDDAELARRARMAMNLGECTPEGPPPREIDHFSPETRLDYPMVGWNYRMSVAQASLGIGQLERLDQIRRTRAGNGAYLRRELAEIEGVSTQRIREGADPCYYTFPMLIRPDAALSRGELLQGLAKEKIDFRLWSHLPLASHAVFGQSGDFPVAQRICAGSLGLRVDPALGLRDMQTAVHAIRRLLEWGERRNAEAGA